MLNLAIILHDLPTCCLGFLFVLLALLASLLFLAESVGTNTFSSTRQRIGRTPDYMVENFSAIRTDEDGHARQMLVAKEMIHYPGR